jgi:hypothetical protein
VAALRERISQLSVAEGSAGSDLQLVSNAEVPSAPDSPRPLRNGVLALFGALFLGVLIALGRDQLSPRISNPRELGRMLDLRVLTGVPYVRGLWRRRTRVMSGVEAEAYETLRSLVELDAPPDRTQTILFTGAVHGEGKTTASWRTAHGLARAGHRVLLVDRARFPSDTFRSHFTRAPAVRALLRWGLLDQVLATGCPPVRERTTDLGTFL